MPARHLSAYSFFVKDFISIHKSTYSQPVGILLLSQIGHCLLLVCLLIA